MANAMPPVKIWEGGNHYVEEVWSCLEDGGQRSGLKAVRSGGMFNGEFPPVEITSGGVSC